MYEYKILVHKIDAQNENTWYSIDCLPFKNFQHEKKIVSTPKFSWLMAVESLYLMFRSDTASISVLKVLG